MPSIFESFVPLSVRKRLGENPSALAQPDSQMSDAAVLFADISGFTPLADKMARQGAAGAEKLSQILNASFEPLIRTTIEHGGDPLKLSGDALIAVWPAHSNDLATMTRRAIQCGLAICDAVLDLESVTGESITMKVCVAAGTLNEMQVGGVDGRWYFAVGGDPLEQLAHLNDIGKPGEVLVSAEAWALTGSGLSANQLSNCWRVISAKDPLPLEAMPAVELTDSAALRLEGFIPDPVRHSVVAGQQDWLAELRRVSALFLKLSAFDHASADAGPRAQEITATLQPVFARYQGLLKEVGVDDKGMVLVAAFGVPPLAHEDDASRAVRAAMAARAALAEKGIPCSIGIATGTAFCGAIGLEHRREYTVVGDVMNLAARVMLKADGGILCDDTTRKAALDAIAFDEPRSIQLKGKAEAVSVCSPLTEAVASVRPQARLVGRTAERESILKAVDALVSTGQPQILTLEGQAGIGKTRLLDVAGDLAIQRAAPVFRGAGDPIETTAPYHAWRPVFSSMLGLTDGSDPQRRRQQALVSLGPDLVDKAPLLNGVLSLGFDETPLTMGMTGRVRALGTRELLVQIVAKRARDASCVLLLEDGHWLDSASWSLAAAVCAQDIPVLTIITARPMSEPLPDAVAEALNAATTGRIKLEALSEDLALELVKLKLEVKDIPAELAELINERACGHPFFSEEIVSTLIELGAIETTDDLCSIAAGVDLKTLALPDTVQASITARIDRVAPQKQLALKVASVIGSSFRFNLLHAVHPVREGADALLENLAGLERAEFTKMESPEPDLTYMFRHILLRDVAYDLMLFEQRRQLHAGVARWYEDMFASDLAPYNQILAHHWENAGDVTRAVDYLEETAVQVFSMGLGKEAVDFGLRAASLLAVDIPTHPEEIMPLMGKEFARIQELLAGRAPKDLLDLPQMEDRKVMRLVALLLRIEPFAHVSAQSELFAFMVLRCFSLTLQHGISPSSGVVFAMYSIVHHTMTGDAATAHQYAEVALDLDQAAGRPTYSPVGFIHTWFNNHWLEHVENSLAPSLEAAEAGLESGDVLYECFNRAAHVVYLAAAGRPLNEVAAVAAKHLELNGGRVINARFHCLSELQNAKALAGKTSDRLSFADAEPSEELDVESILETDNFNQIGFYFVSKLRLHYYYHDYAAALSYADQAIPLLPTFQGQVAAWELVFFRSLALLGRAREVSGDVREEMIARARECVGQLEGWAALCSANFEHKFLIARAELLRTDGDVVAAGESYEQAAASADKAGFTQHVALAYELEAQALASQGDADGAARAVAEARSAYERWGAHAKVADLDERYR